MIFEQLSPNAEQLLKEIIDHRLSTGSCDTEYWCEHFSTLDFEEDAKLRSLYKELVSAEMIAVTWADGVPYSLNVLDKGLSYWDMKKSARKTERKLSRREILISVISAVIGAIISQLPDLIKWIEGLL